MHSEVSNWRKDEDNLKKQLAILAAAIKVEKYGQDFYLKLAACIKDKEGKSILKGLAQDEAQHQHWLEAQIDRISPGKDPSTIAPDTKFTDLLPSNPFPTTGGDTCLKVKDEIKGVETGIQIEKSSIKMYSEAAEMSSDPEARAVLNRLAEWERGHQKILEDNLDYLKKGGSWYGYSPILDG
jgi:rubrerythrin